MQRYVGIALIALAFSVAPATQAQKPDPLIGTWKLDVAKSKFNPGPAPKSVTVTIAEDKVTVEEVDPEGKSVSYSFKESPGTAVPIEGMENATILEKRPDSHHFEHTWKIGERTENGKGVVAKNGKSLRYTISGMNAEGKPFHNVELYAKQ